MLFMRIFHELPRCAVTSRLILPGNHHEPSDKGLSRVKPDYSIYLDPESNSVYQQAATEGYATLVSKEELVHVTKNEYDFAIFPSKTAYEMTRPAFLVRDPGSMIVGKRWAGEIWTISLSPIDHFLI